MKPFPWRPGMALTAERTDLGVVIGRAMKVRPDGRLDIHYRSTDNAYIGQTAILAEMCNPDRTDPATLGALLGVVREAYGEPGIHVAYCWVASVKGNLWVAADHHRHVYAFADTEFDALIATYEAAPVAT